MKLIKGWKVFSTDTEGNLYSATSLGKFRFKPGDPGVLQYMEYSKIIYPRLGQWTWQPDDGGPLTMFADREAAEAFSLTGKLIVPVLALPGSGENLWWKETYGPALPPGTIMAKAIYVMRFHDAWPSYGPALRELDVSRREREARNPKPCFKAWP